MKVKKIFLLNTSDDGSLDALNSTEVTKVILETLSLLFNVNLTDLNGKIYIKDKKLYLSYQVSGDDSDLIDIDWVDILTQKMLAITGDIHEKPNKPRLPVFDEVGLSPKKHDKIVCNINDHRAIFNSLGFSLQHGKKKSS